LKCSLQVFQVKSMFYQGKIFWLFILFASNDLEVEMISKQ